MSVGYDLTHRISKMLESTFMIFEFFIVIHSAPKNCFNQFAGVHNICKDKNAKLRARFAISTRENVIFVTCTSLFVSLVSVRQTVTYYLADTKMFL